MVLNNRARRAIQKSKKPTHPKHPPSGRLFRGPTPENVFQTIDIGTENGRWLIWQAEKNPRRQYLAIDPLFGNREKWRKTQLEQMKPRNILVEANMFQPIMDSLIKKGIRTRHINLDMLHAHDYLFYEALDGPITRMMGSLLSKAPRVLLPNGKIFITTEIQLYRDVIQELASKYGFSIRIKENFLPREFVDKEGSRRTNQSYYRTPFLQDHKNETIYRIELTYGLKYHAKVR